MLTAYYACEKDDTVVKDQQSTDTSVQQILPTIKTVSFDAVGETFTKLKNQYKLDGFLQANSETDILSKSSIDTLGVTIYTDDIKEVTLGDYTSYTMRIVLPDNDATKFYNLTIEDKNGVEGMFMTKYTPTENWMNNKNQTYEGGISSKPIAVLTHEFPDNSGGGDLVPNNPYDNYPEDCDGQIIATSFWLPVQCPCHDAHWPSQIDECPCYTQPGYTMFTNYECIPTNTGGYDGDPYAGNETNPGGGGNSSTVPDAGVGTSIGATILPVDCTEPQTLYPNEPCYVSPYDLCRQNNSVEVCDCEADGGILEDCIFEEALDKLITGMDKECQALELFRSIYSVNSPFATKMKNYFLLSNDNNINIQDVAPGTSDVSETGMPENVGARVIPELISTQDFGNVLIMEFNDTYLDTATTLGFVNTFYHELIHAYMLRLYYSDELLTEYPEYTDLETAIDNFLADETNQNLYDIFDKEMHDIYADFIDDLAETLVAYCDYKEINGVDLDYASKLVWGGLNGYDVFTDNLTPAQRNEAQTLLAYENFNNTDNAKGTKTCE